MGKLYLESEGNSDPNNEKKKWRHKIGQRATIPWRVINTGIGFPSIVYHYHHLHTHPKYWLHKLQVYNKTISFSMHGA
jgi:hypothetical protein